jgi:hypothetical protein
MNETDSAPEQSGAEKPEFDLPAALLRGTVRVAQRKALAVFLAGLGFATALLLITVGSVAAAWDTPYRWHVLLGVTGLYLAIGIAGMVMLLRPVEDPDLTAAREKIDEIRQKAQYWGERLTSGLHSLGLGPDTDDPGTPGFHPRSRTMRWLSSLGSLPIPWSRLMQMLLLWRGVRRRSRR